MDVKDSLIHTRQFIELTPESHRGRKRPATAARWHGHALSRWSQFDRVYAV